MENIAPILLFVYNRPERTLSCLEALKKNMLADQSELFIYSDGAKSEMDSPAVEKVRENIQSIDGFGKVHLCLREKNWGLANNIIDGVTKLVNQFGRVIVLEDDLVAAPYFLKFMNDALETYKDDGKVGHIHACEFFKNDSMPETYLVKFTGSWGWATWDRAWKLFNPDGKALLKELEDKKLTKIFDFNKAYGFTRMLRRQIKGLNDSWAIRWNASLFLNDCYSLNVGKTLIQNTGFDGSGTNCGADNFVSFQLWQDMLPVKRIEPIAENLYARKMIENYYRKTYSFKAKAIRRIKRILKGDFKA